MARKKLTKRQMAILDDLFSGELNEQQVQDKHNVKRCTFNRWLGDEAFAGEFDKRIEWSKRLSEALIARYASVAAAKLVQLTESEKEETARKACLDIISLPRLVDKDCGGKADGGADVSGQEGQGGTMSPETASKMLAVLAEVPASQAENNENGQRR